MGEFVPNVVMGWGVIPQPQPQEMAVVTGFVGTGAGALVEARFNQSLDFATQFIGTGQAGLAALNGVVQPFNGGDISSLMESIEGTLSSLIPIGFTAPSAPSMDGSVNTNFTLFTNPAPVMQANPTIDLAYLQPSSMPTDITAAVSWMESAYESPIYSTLLARLIADLQGGASGVGGTVEQEIYDRYLARTATDNDNKYREIEDYFSSRGFDLPQGALAGRLQEQENNIANNNLEASGKIMIEQADLAQKNNQFVIEASRELEAVLRDFNGRVNDRSLDFAKAVAANTIAIYAERVQAYIADAQVKKDYVVAQIENLKAIIESNRGLLELYKTQAEIASINIDARSKANSAVIEVYKGDIQVFESLTQAAIEAQKGEIATTQNTIQIADARLRAATAAASDAVQAYIAEYGLREKVAEAVANISMQAASSAFGAVNASAGVSHTDGSSKSESWGHSESNSTSNSFSQGVSVSISETYSKSESLDESHSYKE